MKIALYTMNSTVGDFAGNAQKIINASIIAKNQGAKLLVTPELSLCGAPPHDLLLINNFHEQCQAAMDKIAKEVSIPVIIGHPQKKADKLLNALSLIFPINNPQYRKYLSQSNYQNNIIDRAFFAKNKYFVSGENENVFEYSGVRIKCIIAEDLDNKLLKDRFPDYDLLININCSPYFIGKNNDWQNENIYSEIKKPLIILNASGGQDEWVFDGGAKVINPNSNPNSNSNSASNANDNSQNEELIINYFREDIICCEFSSQQIEIVRGNIKTEKLSATGEIYWALKTAIKDYLAKNNINKVFIGLSGGIDSSIVAAICVDAISRENVEFIMLPSMYTSEVSTNGAKKVAENLGSKIHNFPITDLYKNICNELSPFFADKNADLTEENLQARLRAIVLMAFANKFGGLIVNTSNRSEGAMGYGTLYGDLIGGYALIKDLYKREVYDIANYINKINNREIIPQDTITRAPSAELRPNQKDEDSLTQYTLLDEILGKIFEDKKSASELVVNGYNQEEIKKIMNLYYKNEYKRRQFPLGLNIAANSNTPSHIPSTHKFIEEFK